MSDELPKGWCAAKLSELVEFNPKHSRDLPDTLPVSFVPMAAVSETSPTLDVSAARPLGEVRKGYTHFADGDVLFAKITPCMENGKGAVAGSLTNGVGCGTTELVVMRPGAAIDPLFLYRFLAQPAVRSAAKDNFNGTAGQARVPMSFLEELSVPVAPLPEQRRIVAKLEQALARIEASKQRLTKIPVLLKRFRQSVLAAACSGRLTADWRETTKTTISADELLAQVKNQRAASAPLGGKRRIAAVDFDPAQLYDLPDDWAWTTLDQIVEKGRPIIYGIIKPGPHDPNGVPYVRVFEMKDGRVAPMSQLNRASVERASKFTRATLKAGDLLISKDGTIGRVAVVPLELEGANITQHLVRASIHPLISRDYVVYAIRSPHSQHWLVAEKKGVALQGVNVEDFRRLPIPVPPDSEQHEIVRRVDALFKLAEQIEARFEKARAQIEKLTPALLAKAFRGELVSQDPADEPASVLLARIRAERATVAETPAPKRRPARGGFVSG